MNRAHPNSGKGIAISHHAYLVDGTVKDRFKKYVDSLAPSLSRLVSMPPVSIKNLPRGMPEECVYLFSEKGGHLYVGRTNHLRQRLRNHSAPSARENQAPFAFKLAEELTGQRKTGTRRELLEDPEFAEAFNKSKQRIRRMQLRFVAEPDQIRQALLEVYASVVLQTPYNDFETH